MAASDEAEINRLTKEWIAGWYTATDKPFRIEDVASLYDHGPDLTSFDFIGSPEGLVGWSTCAREYQAFMSGVAAWSLQALNVPHISVRGDVAWSSFAVRGEGTLANGQEIAFDGRATLIWARREDGWKIVHEHASVPLSS